MGAAEQYIDGRIADALLALHTAMPCRVVSYANGRATVQPLFKIKEVGRDPVALAPVQNVPVLKQRFRIGGGEQQVYEPVYQAGDIVFVAFSERALDAVMAAAGQAVLPDSRRHHSINDAVILGVLM